MSTPRTEQEFDAFYKDARGRLLLQTYALTGDLPASRSAVRDSFVHAWHHWRKVSRLEDPEAWVRPHAWTHAQRRHTARIWHRDKNLDPGHHATLEALGKLPLVQRKALLLNQLSTTSLEDLGRELGVPAADGERQLQTATASFAVHRDVASTDVRQLLEELRAHTDQTTWPRGSILRRTGDRRRRAHTLVGVAATVVAVVASGVVATDAGGARPDLARAAGPGGTSASPVVERTVDPLPDSAMLTAEQVAAHVPGGEWQIAETTENTTGNGLVMPCQQERYADPKGAAALVREFDTRKRSGMRTVQSTELSRSGRAARRAYATSLDWFGGCVDGRARLLSTHRVENVGDEATLVVLSSSLEDARTIVAGVTRSGRLTSTTVVTSRSADPMALRRPGGLLAAAVNTLCTEEGGGGCAGDFEVVPTAPVPVGMAPGMLAEVDLPAIPGVDKPWVGTEPRKALTNVAATQCDRTDFGGKGMSHALTRTFVMPEANLPQAFGVTETVGTLSEKQARAFVQTVRDRVAACAEKELGTDVTRLGGGRSGRTEYDAWRITMELSDDRSVTYLMGIVRQGTAVAQVAFVPSADATMGPDAFVRLVQRAAQRLAAMPAPA